MSDKAKQDSPDVVVENTASSDTSVKTETTEKVVNSESKPKKASKSSKNLITGLVALVVVLVLIFGSVFLRLGNQTVLARTLDALGQHKLALSSDYIGSKGLLSKQAGAATLDPSKPADCEAIWTQISNTSLTSLQKDLASEDYNKQSSIVKYVIQPVANDYKDKFKFEGIYSTSADVKNNSIAFNTTSSIAVDTDVLKNLVPGGSDAPLDLGLVNLSGTGKFVLQSNKVFVSLPDLNLKAKGLDENGSLTSSYSTDLPQSETTSIFDNEKLNKPLDRLLSQKLGDALSEDTGKAMFAYFCSGIKSYTVEAPKTMDFGSGEYARRKDVRPISMELKPDFYSVYLKGLPNIVEKLSQDPKLKPFLKANYETFKEISQSSTEPTEFPTQEEYNKQVDEMFNDFKKDQMVKDIDQGLVEFDKSVKITAAPIKSYIDLETLQEYGGDFQLTITPTVETLSLTGSPEIASILKEGIVLKANVYDMKYGSKADAIQAPSGSKDIQALPEDFMQTSLGKKLTAMAEDLQNQMMQSSGLDMSDPTLAPIPDGSMMQSDPSMDSGAGNVQLNPDGTYTLPDGTIFDPNSPSTVPNSL
jgi:hypothetical protein